MTGFVNALAILIFMAQLPELTNVTWHVYAMTLAGLGIIYLFPYVPVIGKAAFSSGLYPALHRIRHGSRAGHSYGR